jgi:hypothetical protein
MSMLSTRLEHLPVGPASAAEFAAFQISVIGFSSPVARLERDDIHVLRSETGSIVGGFVIGTRAPFRAIETLPPADQEVLSSRLDLDDLSEIYGVVLAPEVRKGLRSTAFWFAAMRAIKGHGKRTMLGSTVEDGLRKLYASAGGKQVYETITRFNGRVCTATVYTWNVRSMALGFLSGALRREWKKLTRAARPALPAAVDAPVAARKAS